MKYIGSIFEKIWDHKFRNAGILLLLVIGGFLLWKRSSSSSIPPTYQTDTVTKGILVVSVSASGQVGSTNSSAVTTEASGVVKKVYVRDGGTIKAGDPLIEIEFDDVGKQKAAAALSAYQSAKNNLENAKTSLYSLQSKMFAANQKFINDAVERDLLNSDPTYIQQNADWLAAEQQYKTQSMVITQAQTAVNAAWLSYQRSSSKIVAPISGTVSGLSLQEGSVIGAAQSTTQISTKVANILTGATPTVTVNLSEIDVPKVKVGQKATLKFDSLPDKSFTGKVISVDTVGSTTSGVTTYPAVISLDSKTEDLLPNMAASATIITKTKDNVLLIPTTGVLTQNGTTMVRVLKNGEIANIQVETGLSSDTQVEIVSGISEGDEIVTGMLSQVNTRQNGSQQSVFSSFGAGRGMGVNAPRQQIMIQK